MIEETLRNVVSYATNNQNKVALVMSQKEWSKAVLITGLFMPAGTKNVGRNWILPNGSEVTVACISDAPIRSGYVLAAYEPEIANREQLALWQKGSIKELTWQ
jgi:hypothetical protein